MLQLIPEILLWLLVIDLGIATGAGFYEQRMILPQWFTRAADSSITVNRQAMIETDPGRRFWAFVTTGPLTLLTFANLWVAWQSNGSRHDWWLGSAAITLVERIATFSFFIPTAIRLMGSKDVRGNESGTIARRWLALNHIRASLSLLGWLAALKALSLPS